MCKVNGISLNLQYVEFGVPQGSCLAPLLFLLLVNDMTLWLHVAKATMYAEDASLAYNSSSIDDITKSMNAEQENLRKRLHGNKLTLNVAKTTSMIIGTSRKLQLSNSRELTQSHIKISGDTIEQKNTVKYLGIILDNKMKWKAYFSLISLKVSRAIGIIKYAKKLLRSNFLKMLCLGLLTLISDIAALSGAHVGSLPAKP